MEPTKTVIHYEDTALRGFALMTVVWGIVGMLVGVWIAAQLLWPALNFDIEYLSYGRLRPLHTNAVIFAFGGSALFASSYWCVQRTCRAPLFLPWLSKFTFWGWTLVGLAGLLVAGVSVVAPIATLPPSTVVVAPPPPPVAPIA